MRVASIIEENAAKEAGWQEISPLIGGLGGASLCKACKSQGDGWYPCSLNQTLLKHLWHLLLCNHTLRLAF